MRPAHRTIRGLPTVLALTLAAGLTPAAAVAQAPGLPAASALLERHVAAVGGEAAIRRHTSTRVAGTFELPAAGLRGELTMLSVAPNRTLMRIVVGGLGEIVSGFDGTNVWSVDPMQGARLADGAQLEMQRELADFYGTLGKQPGVVSRTTVEQTELGGVPCYKVKVTWKSGRETHECYAVDGGLLVGQQMRTETAQGATDVTVLIGEYKDFGGTKAPTVIRQQSMGMEQVIRITSLEHDTVTPAELEPPAPIQTLLREKGAASPPTP